MGCCRALYHSIAASTSAFFVLGQEMPSGSIRPSGTACCTKAFIDRGRKKPKLRRLYCRIEPDNTPYMQYIHHFRLLYSFSVQHRVGFQKSEYIHRNMNSGICSQIKLEPHLQLDRKPFKRKGNILMMCQILVLIWFFRKRNIKKLLI